MRQVTIFEKGDKVRVTKNGYNASDFTFKYNVNPIGVYSIDWENIVFEIGELMYQIKFEHSPEIYGAYPLLRDGKLIGYVYNNALELVEE